MATYQLCTRCFMLLLESISSTKEKDWTMRQENHPKKTRKRRVNDCGYSKKDAALLIKVDRDLDRYQSSDPDEAYPTAEAIKIPKCGA